MSDPFGDIADLIPVAEQQVAESSSKARPAQAERSISTVFPPELREKATADMKERYVNQYSALARLSLCVCVFFSAVCFLCSVVGVLPQSVVWCVLLGGERSARMNEHGLVWWLL
jgi:hypothetical protein